MTNVDEYMKTVDTYYKLHRAASLLTTLQADLMKSDVNGEVIALIERAATVLGFEMGVKERECRRLAYEIKAERKDNGKENLD